jgi:hypothetical protein
MYATAQRVLSPRGVAGVNAFLHLHREAAPEFDWSSIERIANGEPGELVAEHLEVVPVGGNRVLSFLDVACPDHTPPARVVEALAYMEKTLGTRQRPSIRRYPLDIVVRFDFVGALGEAEANEFEALRLSIEAILKQQQRPAWIDKEPLTVEAHRKGNTVVLRLDEPSRRRVAAQQDVQLPLAILHVDLDVRDLFERLHGDLIRQVLPAVTGLELERVREQGGARVIRAEDRKVLWEWPRRG